MRHLTARKPFLSAKLFIHATNVHQGGGRSLLMALLELLPESAECVLIVDERMTVPLDMLSHIENRRVRPTISDRFRAERWLARRVSEHDLVLCFGNLPPLFKLRGRAVVMVQNRYLVEDVELSGFPLSVRLRLLVERMWFTARMSSVTEFIVQTPTMKKLLERKTRGQVPVRVLPFTADSNRYARGMPASKAQKEAIYDFVYVASGEPHKNHRRLIEAWCLLAKEGIFPSLVLTLDEARFAGLCRRISAMQQRYGLMVNNFGELSRQDILAVYRKARASIYPSIFESFGLPLIEARQAGLPVLASELDYVRDVLDPEETFDPGSAESIARAVKRFLYLLEAPLNLRTPAEFLADLLGEGRCSGSRFDFLGD